MKANRFISLRKDDHAIAAQLGAVIALLVAILVGVMVYWQLAKSTSDSLGNYNAANILGKAAFNTTNSTANTVFQLAPIIGIVAIAGIILFIVTRFGQGGQV